MATVLVHLGPVPAVRMGCSVSPRPTASGPADSGDSRLRSRRMRGGLGTGRVDILMDDVDSMAVRLNPGRIARGTTNLPGPLHRVDPAVRRLRTSTIRGKTTPPMNDPMGDMAYGPAEGCLPESNEATSGITAGDRVQGAGLHQSRSGRV